jgi:hypothetical protein
MAFGESTSGKSLDHQAWKSSALGVVPGDGTEVRRGNTYEQCKGNLTNLRRELHLSLAKGNPK